MHVSGKLLVHVHVTSQSYVHTFPLLFLQAEKFKLATRITMKLHHLSLNLQNLNWQHTVCYWRKSLFIGKLRKVSLAVQFLGHTELYTFVEIHVCLYIVQSKLIVKRIRVNSHTDSQSTTSSTQVDIYVEGVSTEIQEDDTSIDLSENSKCQLCD